MYDMAISKYKLSPYIFIKLCWLCFISQHLVKIRWDKMYKTVCLRNVPKISHPLIRFSEMLWLLFQFHHFQGIYYCWTFSHKNLYISFKSLKSSIIFLFYRQQKSCLSLTATVSSQKLFLTWFSNTRYIKETDGNCPVQCFYRFPKECVYTFMIMQ